MKTLVLMKRDFDGTPISQRTDNSYLNATELLSVYNSNSGSNKRFADFWENQSTQDFLQSLENEINLNVPNSPHLKTDLYISTKGRGGATYMHPYLFVKFAMWLSSDFEVKVIKWVYDNLIHFRNEAGDNYRLMCDTINNKYIEYFGNKPDPLIFAKEANYLNLLVFGDERKRQRNEATEKQLDLLNKLQLANITMINEGIAKDSRKENLRTIAKYF